MALELHVLYLNAGSASVMQKPVNFTHPLRSVGIWAALFVRCQFFLLTSSLAVRHVALAFAHISFRAGRKLR